MSAPARILHTADSHIGAALPVRPRLTRPRRGDDFVDSFARVLDLAVEHGVELVIHSGDLFNRSNPSSRALAAAAEPLLKLAVAGVSVVIVPGNHERSMIPATLLLAHPNIHVVTEPCTLTFRLGGTRLAISALPCLRRDSARDFPASLEATGWSKASADLRILAVHQTFESATCGPGDYRFRSGDDVVERTAVPAEFDYVAAGHVHRHQSLSPPVSGGPPIVYSGSPDRISFAEASEPKGCVLIEEAGGTLAHRFVEHDVRPMVVCPMNVTGLTGKQILQKLESTLAALPPRAITQVRLAGCASRYVLRGLSFTGAAGRYRPDVLFTISTRAVEFNAHRAHAPGAGPTSSAFSALNAPSAASLDVSIDDVKKLPTRCGVYSLYDAAGRLLYVGKSKNVRGRVRSHLRATTGGNFFSGWSRQIERAETRPADSELEALLIEAELIRLTRPPFNRQMRRWTDYCYLGENGKPHGQLDIRRQTTAGHRCFGPFRSRQLAATVREAVANHFGLAMCPGGGTLTNQLPLLCDAPVSKLCERYYQRLCSGPCAGIVEAGDYHRRIRRRDALLTGSDDEPLGELESLLDAKSQGPRDDGHTRDLSRLAKTLRQAFDHALTLRQAERLLNGILLLPHPGGGKKVAMLTRKGVHFDALEDRPADAARVLARHRAIVGRSAERPSYRLPTTALDSLCIASRHIAADAESHQYGFIPARVLAGLNAEALLARAFGVTRTGNTATRSSRLKT